ncbi:ADP-heptose:LPS heptosyltransferase [Oceanospirillum multiglobuliferum]|uniref:ADP-heptose--LPS heptosyltransferase n=1 Tax=Oceanospirillum multiglobuliferum TaxID=64969 RepID=A0A1T4S926_9GAMM|nr:glycosyltransferase family 9 protein [Oceanospirillum multiglobuliferum]OPX54370.1 hypothetical protein BTE48_14605 [Oceanospirillum multiglobuliferum]SKA24743.1 ADP-heptose:LPS heptosyltransferase [Oceanospirillum multiglobuliferum]
MSLNLKSLDKLKILVVRNDKLGDFMLAWPALALLKRSLPKAQISVLVPKYTAPVAELCPWVDHVLLDPNHYHDIKSQHFDILLTLFSTPRIGWLGLKNRIPMRIAPATKLAQFFYNHRVVQRRSHSEKPEYEYNIDLVLALLKHLKVVPAQNLAPYWPLPLEQRQKERRQLCQQLKLNNHEQIAFVHPGSGGSATNLSIEQYAELIQQLDQKNMESNNNPIQWVISAGPSEIELANCLIEATKSKCKVVLYASSQGLATFAQSISAADLFIAGSTGPLHIAGALDVPTVGFFPIKRSAKALRWRPCNSLERHLALSPEAFTDDDNQVFDALNIPDCSDKVYNWQQSLSSVFMS